MKMNINRLSKKYDNHILFKDVNLEFYPNDFIIIYGESGCGKTTLLNCLIGLSKIDSGEIFYDNHKLDEHYREYLLSQKVSYVFQDHRLLDELNVQDNILSGCKYSNKNIDYDWYRIICESLKIDNILNKSVKEISIGQRQRVALARALIKKPTILLLDEPTGNLDSDNSHFLMQLLKKIQDRIPLIIVMVTHEQSLKKYGNRILCFQNGQILEETNCIMKNDVNMLEDEQLKSHYISTFWFVKKYLYYHFYYYIFISFCISICCFAMFLSMNVGTQFKEYIYNVALNTEYSKEIQLKSSNNGRVKISDIKEIEKLPHVVGSQYYLKDSYAFERKENELIQIKYNNNMITEKDKMIDFFQFESNVVILEGSKDIQDNEIVVEDSLVKELQISNPIGKKLKIRIPFASYFEKIELTDSTVNSNPLFQTFRPVNKNIELVFVIKGVMQKEDDNAYRIYHNKAYLETLVDKYAKKDLTKNQISAMSVNEATIEIESVDYLKDIAHYISENYPINCDSRVYMIMECLDNISSIEFIYNMLSIFIVFTLTFVLYSIVVLNHSQKQRFLSITQFLGAKKKDMLLFYMFEMISISFFVGLIFLAISTTCLPIINKLFSINNSIVISTQFAVSQEIQLFSINWMQLFITYLFGIGIVLFLQLNSFFKMKKTEFIKLLNWEVR